jgi:lipopolysaccharide transport system ATP-binding protein
VGPILEANKLSKSYHLWNRPSDRLVAAALQAGASIPLLPQPVARRLGARADRLSRTFIALNDVSLSLHRGESLGIIGRNGSGKSTLLQIVAGTLTPSSGDCRVHGRVAALLELGSGFNPEFSGRENVILQAALAGVTPEATKSHLQEVEEFAAIGEFIDQPVKTYSSGMMVRLAFATQTILRPDIFIVDEALAVGDIFFQAKCARFFQQRLAAGMSLLFVSHDLTSVKTLCRNALVLDSGNMTFFGPSADAISHYHHLHSGQGRQDRREAQPKPDAPHSGVLRVGQRRNWSPTTEIGSREAEIIHCRVCDDAGAETRSFGVGEGFSIEIFVEAHTAIEHLQFALEISTRQNLVVYGVSSIHLGIAYESLTANEIKSFIVTFEPVLGAGDYFVDVALGCGDRGDGAPTHHVHRVAHIAAISLRHTGLRPSFLGAANLGARMTIRSSS